MDIWDSQKHLYFTADEQEKFMKIIRLRYARTISEKKYLKKLSEFWDSIGHPDYAKEMKNKLLDLNK